MNFNNASIILPCHSWEDLPFPVHRTGQEAEGLLSAWTALWHPALLARTRKLPVWHFLDCLPQIAPPELVIVPAVKQPGLPAGWSDQTRQQGNLVFEGPSDRQQLIAGILAATNSDSQRFDGELVADFLALGFCYLQIELLTSQMHYESQISASSFPEHLIAAAEAACEGRGPDAVRNLQSCFDLLLQARHRFYPVDCYLLDVVLVAPNTIGQALRDELARPTPTNLLLSGAVLQQLAQREPATCDRLVQAQTTGQACVVGGGFEPTDLTLWPPEKILADFQLGRAVYQQHLHRAPSVYGRYGMGLSPLLPQLLSRLGFHGALHATFDGGRVPSADQAKIRWEGADGSAIDAVANVPLDAALVDNFMSYSQRLAESMNLDHVATLCFAHWPGTACTWFDDLRRASAYGPALGKFVTLENYFASTRAADRPTRFEPDQYASPGLRQAIDAGDSQPISRSAELQSECALESAEQVVQQMCLWTGSEFPSSREAGAKADLATSAAKFAEQLNGTKTSGGYLLINTASTMRRMNLQLTGLASPPERSQQVRAVGTQEKIVQLVADVPALGFCWIESGPKDFPEIKSSKKRVTELPLAEANLLRNEHFEAVVNPTTGALAAIRRHGRRGTFCSAQLVFVPAAGRGAQESFSVMAADAVEISALSDAMGEITSRGRLLNREGRLLAKFTQTLQLWRGSRVLELDIRLEPEVLPGPDPWQSYYATRLAWSDGTGQLWRNIHGSNFPTDLTRIDSPHGIDIQMPPERLTLLSGGLPYHRRIGPQLLDTILIAGQEKNREFPLGIGVDLASPLSVALERLLPPQRLTLAAEHSPRQSTGWFMHLDVKHVIATGWEPLRTGETLSGFRVRLLETEGRAGHVGLTSFRPVSSALKTDYLGQPLETLPVEQEKISIEMAACEWAQLEVRWP